MSNSSKDNSNPSSMVDVDLVHSYFGDTIGITVYDGDDDDLDNLLARGYRITGIVTIL